MRLYRPVRFVLPILLCAACSNGASQPRQPSADEAVSAIWWLEQAFDAATQIQDDKTRRNLLEGILGLQAQAGDMQAANETARRIRAELPEAPSKEFAFYKKLSEAFARAGQFDAAMEVVEKARPIAPPARERRIAGMLVEIVREQAKHGDVSGAKALAQRIDLPEYRWRALDAIGYQQLENDFDAALETFRSVPPEGRISVLALARHAREADRWDDFSRVIRNALQQAEQTTIHWRGVAYRDIGQMLAEAEQEKLDPQLVEEVRQTIVEFVKRPEETDAPSGEYQRAVEEAAHALVDLKEYDVVRQVIETVSDHRASVLNTELAEALAREGRYDDALKSAEQAMPLHQAFRNVAVAQADRGDFETAKETASLSRSDDARNWAYHEIAVRQARQGLFAEAKETLGSITPSRDPHPTTSADYHKAAALKTIAREQLEAGQRDEARTTLKQAAKLTRKIEKIQQRIEFKGLARMFIEIGDFDMAQELAEEIRDADPLLYLAERHLEAGRVREFEAVLRRAEVRTSQKTEPEELWGEGASLHAKSAALRLKAGEPEKADEEIRQLLDAAHKMEPSLHKMVVYTVAGAFYVHTNQIDDHWRRVAAMRDPVERAYAALGTAHGILEPQRWGGAWSDGTRNP